MGGSAGAIREVSSMKTEKSSFRSTLHLCSSQRQASHLLPEDVDGDTASEMAPKNSHSAKPSTLHQCRFEMKCRKGCGGSSALLRRLISPQSFTKGYYHCTCAVCSSRKDNAMPSILPAILEQISILPKGSIAWIRIFILFYIFLFFSSNLPKSDAAILEQSKCETHGWNAFPVWKYRAKPRFVPPLRTDRKMQEEFFQLFRGGEGHGHDKDSSSSEEDEMFMDIDMLQRIASMCPKDAFFYSLSPKHVEATTLLGRMFVAQPSPPAVLKLAKALLKTPYVNPKVWYHALVGAAQERTDMTGFKLAHLIDAMPDLFIPGHLLFEVMGKYRSALQSRQGLSSNTTRIAFKNNKKRSRGKRAVDALSSPSPLSKSSPSPRKTVKKLVRKYIKQNETSPANSTARRVTVNARGQRKEGEGVTAGLKASLSNSTRSGRNYKYESKGTYKNKRKYKSDKTKKNHRKPEVHKEDISELPAESGISWQKARTGSDGSEDCILVDGSIGIHNGIENKLWYFREDLMVNQHHWYWHQEYPLNTTMHRPRRAELFFYMHRNLIARYNAERLSNHMPKLEALDLRPGSEIKTAYDSHLADVNSGKFWTPRPHGVRLQDVFHMEDPDFERDILVGKYNELYGRLIRSIQVGHLLLSPLRTVKIRNTKGIEPLGNTVEASTLNVNPVFYDAMGFHNLGHQLIGLQTDPKFLHRLPTGVMADTSTTMRDPEFFSYHTVIDDLFDKYKKSLPPYKLRGGEYPLKWDGVEILDVEVISKTGGPKNQLKTFWSTKKFELAPGVDQSIHKGDLDVDVCAVHLNHESFDFKVTVTLDPCAKTKSNKGTVRIFLAPRFDEEGHRIPLIKQRRLMIHMDSFPVDLRVGQNVIYRRSFDSNAVTPWTKHLSDYEKGPKNPHAADFCGCGWPTHLFIPKGSPDGLPFDLFVMITNFDHDFVEDHPDDLSIPEPCNSPFLYCGVKWRQYPDAKPMGYPFDRLPFTVPISCPKGVASVWTLVFCRILQFFLLRPVGTLEEYVSYAPNMGATVVEIKHFDHLAW